MPGSPNSVSIAPIGRPSRPCRQVGAALAFHDFSVRNFPQAKIPNEPNPVASGNLRAKRTQFPPNIVSVT